MSRSDVYRYALTPTSQFFFCSVPFRLDISPNCIIGCKYCFNLARGGYRNKNNRLVDPNAIARKLEVIFEKFKENVDINGELLKHRMPIHLGGLSDPFSSIEHSKLSLQMISILANYEYPLILSSKQTQYMIKDDFLSAIKKLKYKSLQVSIPIPNNSLSRIIEPGAPLFTDRINHIKFLVDEGFHVIARIQPIILPLIDEIYNSTIPALKQAGCEHVILECLKIPVERSELFKSLFLSLKWDGYENYAKRGAILVGRDKVLPPIVAWEQVKCLVDQLNELEMTYGTTDHGLFHLGNTSCCCGVADKKGFEGIFKGNFANIISTSNQNPILFSQVIDHWIPEKSISMYVNSNSRLPGINSFSEHLRDKWNRPGNGNAPDSYLGVIYTGEKDNNGDCIYDKSGVDMYLNY
jgi:DNA repair photolyase